MNAKRDKIWRTTKDYCFITFAMALYGFGFTAFILPEKVVIGGMAGLSSLLYFTTGIPVAVGSLTMNLILLAVAYKIVGRKFVIGTIYGVAASSFFIGLFQPLFANGLVNDTFINLIIGGVLCGAGIGLCFIHNGSSGGTDIVAAIVTKYSNVSIGRVMLLVDAIIISSGFFVFGSIDKIVYGFIILVLYSYVADMIINSPRQAVQFVIFSSKWSEIADAITIEAHRGCTVFEGQGWYTHRPVKMVMCMCRKIEAMEIYRMVKSIDKDAFVTQSNVNGVYGRGFDEMKLKNKKNYARKQEKHLPEDGLPVFNERQVPPLDSPEDHTVPQGHPLNRM